MPRVTEFHEDPHFVDSEVSALIAQGVPEESETHVH
jgi:hypothetical protein